MRRPALADVLAAVCCDTHCAGWWRAEIAAGMRVGCDSRGASTPTATVPWSHATTADALDVLDARGLLPEHWSDPVRAPRWWCRCGGAGDGVWRHDVAVSCAHGPDRRGCGGAHWTAPDSHPALVAVASLGVDALARVEELVAETWRARVVWRVERPHDRRDRLRSRRGSQAFGLSAEEPLEVFAASEAWQAWPSGAWPEECPGGFLALSGGDGEVILRAWPALRALAALGLHLLAIDDGRVTLGVEALP